MRIEVQGTGKRIKGIEAIQKLSKREFLDVFTSMTRFTFNLQSVSFVIMEDITPRGRWLGEKTVILLKVRCNHPTVEFKNPMRCEPGMSEIAFIESSNGVEVFLDDKVSIHCSDVVARVEEVDIDKVVVPGVSPVIID